MNPSTIIKRLGGVSAVARMFDIKPPSVSEWQKSKKGIPKGRLQYIAVVRPDALRPEPEEDQAEHT